MKQDDPKFDEELLNKSVSLQRESINLLRKKKLAKPSLDEMSPAYPRYRSRNQSGTIRLKTRKTSSISGAMRHGYSHKAPMRNSKTLNTSVLGTKNMNQSNIEVVENYSNSLNQDIKKDILKIDNCSMDFGES